MWAVRGSDEHVLATGRSPRSPALPPFRTRNPAFIQPCSHSLLGGLRGRLLWPLTWPVCGRPACVRCALCTSPDRKWAVGCPSPTSAALRPWLWPLSCPPGLLGPTPFHKGHVMEKLVVGWRQEVTEWEGQAKGGQIKAGGLSTGWPGTRDRGLTRAQRSAGGLLPILVSESLSRACGVPLHSFTHSCAVLEPGGCPRPGPAQQV